MRIPDLNLLIALDALLSEGSVNGAARRVHLSTSAMSHVLARIRETVGDPILVRTGNRLVPTARALAMREETGRIVAEACNLLRHANSTCLSEMEREFVLRTPEGIPIVHGAALITELHREMPRSALRFVPESDDDAASLREGHVHLDIGASPDYDFEIRIDKLFEQRLVGVVRDSNQLLRESITLERFIAAKHVAFLQRGRVHGPIDIALAALKLKRSVSLVVPSAYGALMAAASSNLVATVPGRLVRNTQVPLDVQIFDLPLAIPVDHVVQAWLPRFDADPAHQYLRECVKSVLTRNNRNVPDAGQRAVQNMNVICPPL